jgi:hypothetical protein
MYNPVGTEIEPNVSILNFACSVSFVFLISFQINGNFEIYIYIYLYEVWLLS